MSHLEDIGKNYHSESSKAYRRFLAYGVILLMFHLLDLKAQKFSQFGLSVQIRDVIIIYGALAGVTLYQMFTGLYCEMASTSIFTFDPYEQHRKRAEEKIKNDNPNISDKDLKKLIKKETRLYTILLSPYFMTLTFVVLAILIVSSIDVFKFGKFLFSEHILPYLTAN